LLLLVAAEVVLVLVVAVVQVVLFTNQAFQSLWIMLIVLVLVLGEVEVLFQIVLL
tara:strand:+ start:571 stop:735 length:165 start_codon:yes stop_codon:yes gene_type:complete